VNNLWWGECRRISVVLLVALVLGSLLGATMLMLLLGIAAILGWQLWNLYRFIGWIKKGRKAEIPDQLGVWGDAYYQIHRLRNRQRKTAGRLANLLGRYKALAAALPDGAVVLAEDHSIEWMNRAASELLVLDRSTDLGKPVDNLIRQPVFSRYLRAEEYKEPIKLTAPTSDERVLQIYMMPYGQGQRLLLARDITRLHRLEEMRRDFVANVSHELRTPLTVMSGYLETLLENDSNDKTLSSALKQMNAQAERMKHLVEDLLLISRLETENSAGKQTKVDVPAMLNSLLMEARILSAERNHVILMEVDNSLYLQAVENELHSVFTNLIKNALQYTADNGEIIISWFADDDGAHFSVKDRGIGIAPQNIPRLTERFYRVDAGRSRAVGGTGLGLAIVNHVLKNHQAALRIESMPGKGSTFSCDFPARRIVQA